MSPPPTPRHVTDAMVAGALLDRSGPGARRLFAPDVTMSVSTDTAVNTAVLCTATGARAGSPLNVGSGTGTVTVGSGTGMAQSGTETLAVGSWTGLDATLTAGGAIGKPVYIYELVGAAVYVGAQSYLTELPSVNNSGYVMIAGAHVYGDPTACAFFTGPPNLQATSFGSTSNSAVDLRLLGANSNLDRCLALTPAESVATSKIGAISPLAGLIAVERSVAEIEPSHLIVADAAMNDALAVVNRANLDGSPNVMFSEDGILTLQWQRGEFGVALIFAGDGTASIAFRRPGQLYAQNGIDIAVSDDLPQAFNDALASVLG